MGMRSSTAGERLYYLVRDEMLDLAGSGAVRWGNIGLLFEPAGSEQFSNYVRGALAVHVTRFLLRYWADEKLSVPDEAQHVRKIASFIKKEVFTSIGQEDGKRLARAVMQADLASNRSIGAGCRAAVLAERNKVSCYLCGDTLNPKAKQGHATHATLEHLWPASMGGDSIEANLLPACEGCQKTTKDTLSWEWTNIHNLILPSVPSVGALDSVTKRYRYARHYFEAIQLSAEEHMTLKEAFLRLGPIKDPITHIATGRPITFFDLQTA